MKKMIVLVSMIFLVLMVGGLVSADDPFYGKPEISIKFTSDGEIGVIGINESFGIYGNVQNQPAEHYIEYILPENCTFKNTEGDYSIGGRYAEDSQTKKVFNSETGHNFNFLSFKCHYHGMYSFRVKLQDVEGNVLATAQDRIYVSDEIDPSQIIEDIYTKKSFYYNGRMYEDECISLDFFKDDFPELINENGEIPGVKEVFIDGTSVTTHYKICPSGKCKDGACVKKENNSVNGDEEKTKLNFKLSNGRKAEIKIMPETASETAIARLGELNFTIELKEVGKGNDITPVYELTGNKQGKFLGIFKIMASERVQVDAETGEVKVIRPWWSFLVSGI